MPELRPSSKLREATSGNADFARRRGRPRTRRRTRPRKGGGFMWRAIAHQLEGSHFGACAATLAIIVLSLVPPKRAKTGGSRERPRAIHAPVAFDLFKPGL